MQCVIVFFITHPVNLMIILASLHLLPIGKLAAHCWLPTLSSIQHLRMLSVMHHQFFVLNVIGMVVTRWICIKLTYCIYDMLGCLNIHLIALIVVLPTYCLHAANIFKHLYLLHYLFLFIILYIQFICIY